MCRMMHHLSMTRTTVTLDDDIYDLVSVYASARNVSLGTAIGDLIRRSHATSQMRRRVVVGEDGLPIIPANGRAITPEMVKAAQDDEVR